VAIFLLLFSCYSLYQFLKKIKYYNPEIVFSKIH
jgi:hypothetical protein